MERIYVTNSIQKTHCFLQLGTHLKMYIMFQMVITLFGPHLNTYLRNKHWIHPYAFRVKGGEGNIVCATNNIKNTLSIVYLLSKMCIWCLTTLALKTTSFRELPLKESMCHHYHLECVSYALHQYHLNRPLFSHAYIQQLACLS